MPAFDYSSACVSREREQVSSTFPSARPRTVLTSSPPQMQPRDATQYLNETRH